jgi:hypothetical protein
MPLFCKSLLTRDYGVLSKVNIKGDTMLRLDEVSTPAVVMIMVSSVLRTSVVAVW